MQFQRKLMNQTWENGKKPSLGSLWPKLDPQKIFSWILPLLDVRHYCKLSLYAISRKTKKSFLGSQSPGQMKKLETKTLSAICYFCNVTKYKLINLFVSLDSPKVFLQLEKLNANFPGSFESLNSCCEVIPIQTENWFALQSNWLVSIFRASWLEVLNVTYKKEPIIFFSELGEQRMGQIHYSVQTIHFLSTWDALRFLLLFVQFKKPKKTRMEECYF